MINPYELIFDRLGNIENILLDIKHSPQLPRQNYDDKKPFRLKGAAEYLGIAETSVYGLVAKGKLKPLKPGKHLLFTRECLDSYLNGDLDRPDPSTFLRQNKKAVK